MPTLLEVWESRLGIQEVPGPKHNPIIVGWAADAGHPEIVDDETSWCSLAACSAAKEAGLPFPPTNVNPMARSWLTWGVRVAPGEVQPGDVAIWSRGNPKGPFGHVNCVKEVRKKNGRIEVRCIGGNQSGLKGGDAVTLTAWLDSGKALGFRRPVPATVKDLRTAGSSTIKDADTQEKLGIGGIFSVPIFEGVRTVFERMFGSVEPPQFASLPDGISWWGTLLDQADRVVGYAVAHPWLATVLVIGIGLVVHSQLRKRGRVAEHAAGIPIAAEVAKLQEA